MIYLASPYTHDDPKIREHRYEQACDAAARYMDSGYYIYAPIAHSHGICLAGGGHKFSFDFWRGFDYHMIDLSEELWVLQLEGWQQSKGVAAEIAYALSKGKPVRYV